ncbi:MAG: Panacea domain-containing protein [Candidatus Brocadiia bacterium]
MRRSEKVKLMQVVAYFLRDEPSQRLNYMRLIKLIYLADRRSLEETGETMTHSRFVAMDRGPVLSELYDYIKGEYQDFPEWQRFFQKQHYEIVMREDPGIGKLSSYEAKVLQEIKEEHVDRDEFDLAEWTHKLEEWEKNKPPLGSSQEIPNEDLLEAVGRSEDIELIREQAASRQFLASLAEGRSNECRDRFDI